VFRSWGGARRGAGRPKKSGSGVPHLARPRLSRHHPLHVTFKLRPDAPRLRNRRAFRAIYRALVGVRERFGGRVVHYSVQRDHVHLLVEAPDRRGLSRSMQGLAIRVAKSLNGVFARAGRVFADRYHARQLKTPLEVRRALLYVFRNAAKHAAQRGAQLSPHYVDPFSSALWFDAWAGAPRATPLAYIALADARRAPLGADDPRASPGAACEVCSARSYLLRVGWRRHGLLPVDNDVVR
jgi:REP element-mobilizing transposase RayT